MKKIKGLFATPKKTAVTLICTATIIVMLSICTLFIVNAVAENSSIGAENAKNFAFADAGIDPVSAKIINTEFSFEEGHFVYEVEFIADGKEYEYLIKASDGSVIKKQTENVNDNSVNNDMNHQDNSQNPSASDKIDLDTAKNKALADAGVSISDVTFTETKADYDDGKSLYDIEFYTSTHKYDYEIDALSGEIHSKNIEVLVDDNVNTDTYIGLDKAKSIAVNHAGLSVSNVTFTKANLDKDDGQTIYEIEFYKDGIEYDYEINALTGTIIEYDIEK